jgi:hypothetical protein
MNKIIDCLFPLLPYLDRKSIKSLSISSKRIWKRIKKIDKHCPNYFGKFFNLSKVCSYKDFIKWGEKDIIISLGDSYCALLYKGRLKIYHNDGTYPKSIISTILEIIKTGDFSIKNARELDYKMQMDRKYINVSCSGKHIYAVDEFNEVHHLLDWKAQTRGDRMLYGWIYKYNFTYATSYKQKLKKISTGEHHAIGLDIYGKIHVWGIENITKDFDIDKLNKIARETDIIDVLAGTYIDEYYVAILGFDNKIYQSGITSEICLPQSDERMVALHSTYGHIYAVLENGIIVGGFTNTKVDNKCMVVTYKDEVCFI